MPKLVSKDQAKSKWNFYMPIGLKLKMHQKLLTLGQQRKQSALVRALLRMFVDGDIDEKRLLVLIEEETYIKENGQASKL